jgi:cellulose synthase/poly-beta-1,6-N-acetylglucosamine synthase-like glycosyltransferase
MYIPKQRNIGSFFGGLKTIFSSVTFYIGLMNFVLLLVTAYNTTLKFYLPIPFWLFFIITIICLLIAMLIEYIWIMPSGIMFANRQSWEHDNPIRREFEKLNERLDKIERERLI